MSNKYSYVLTMFRVSYFHKTTVVPTVVQLHPNSTKHTTIHLLYVSAI